MKKLIFFFLFISLISGSVVFAHPGGTDGSGGHKNHSTGEYHYHHGYSAHQHTDGVCPYDFDDQTNHSSSDTQSIESGREPDYIVDINGNVTKVRRDKKTDNDSSNKNQIVNADNTVQSSSGQKTKEQKSPVIQKILFILDTSLFASIIFFGPYLFKEFIKLLFAFF